MEAMACRDALDRAGSAVRCAKGAFGDGLSGAFVQLWGKRETQRSAMYPILTEIKELSLLFIEFSFTFASRSCNKVAHVLTKQVTSTNRTSVWHESPDCARDNLESDCNSGRI